MNETMRGSSRFCWLKFVSNRRAMGGYRRRARFYNFRPKSTRTEPRNGPAVMKVQPCRCIGPARHVITFAVPEAAIVIENLNKLFPSGAGGWRSFLQPF